MELMEIFSSSLRFSDLDLLVEKKGKIEKENWEIKLRNFLKKQNKLTNFYFQQNSKIQAKALEKT